MFSTKVTNARISTLIFVNRVVHFWPAHPVGRRGLGAAAKTKRHDVSERLRGGRRLQPLGSTLLARRLVSDSDPRPISPPFAPTSATGVENGAPSRLRSTTNSLRCGLDGHSITILFAKRAIEFFRERPVMLKVGIGGRIESDVKKDELWSYICRDVECADENGGAANISLFDARRRRRFDLVEMPMGGDVRHRLEHIDGISSPDRVNPIEGPVSYSRSRATGAYHDRQYQNLLDHSHATESQWLWVELKK
jgi:hypothetical protein